MNVMTPSKPKETTIVELKAKVESLEPFRQKLDEMSAERMGTFRQIDTYYEVPAGRLKLRETDGEDVVQLVYYERPDVEGPKQSRVFVAELPKPQFTKQFLSSVLRVKTVVDKQRTIYRLKGTQVHLDKVEGLGTYVEFERPSEDMPQATRRARETLEKLMRTLGIKPNMLEKGSYSDLLAEQATNKELETGH
jgi:predicted adenylyl cyclase CyaB